MSVNYLKRIRKVQQLLRAEKRPSALLLSSSPQKTYSRDQHYPYRQDSDFYYLTGTHAENISVLITNTETAPLLVVPSIDPQKVLWDGKPPSYRSIAKRIGAKLETVKSHHCFVLQKQLAGIEQLYFQNIEGTAAWSVAKELMALPSHQRVNFPSCFTHSDALLEPLRLFKDASEVALIREAGRITADALKETLPLIRKGVKESEIAAHILYQFQLRGCEEAFHTISAAGASAATLHYHAHTRKLRDKELYLLDFGAAHQMYCADITRTLPVGGRFTPEMQELYEIVLAAKDAATAKIKSGVQIKTVYDASAKVLTQGLKDLGVLKGSVSALMNKAAYRPYFPHGIGHSLGIDVHDIGKLRGNTSPVLRQGMVFTIEPGLYFPKPVAHLPACGVRIEDDILVTKSGHRNLTPDFPVRPGEIETLMG
jgi:Xaa-Pro aminopeptidase